MNKHKNKNISHSDYWLKRPNQVTYVPNFNPNLPLWPHMRTERRIKDLEKARVWKYNKETKTWDDLGPRYPAMIEWLEKVKEAQKKEYDRWQESKKVAAQTTDTTTT